MAKIKKRLSTMVNVFVGEATKTTVKKRWSNIMDNPAFLTIFKGKVILSAADFREVWMHYDADANGYIEEQEIDRFMSDLFEAQGQIISKSDITALKKTLLDCYDSNRDGKIELSEMVKILPVEDNFLLKFKIQNKTLTYPNFLRIWEFYDSDNSGYLEKSELESFISDLIKTNKNISVKSKEMELIMEGIYGHFDANRNGLIEQHELKDLLNVPDNYLSNIELYKNLSKKEFTAIFQHYDRDCDGYLEGEEMLEIVSDMMRKVEITLTISQLEQLVERVIKVIDTDFDGKISKTELADLFFTTGEEQLGAQLMEQETQQGSEQGSAQQGIPQVEVDEPGGSGT